MIDWDGTPSEYLTPHPTPESGSNVLVPLPGRWSGGYDLCTLLITGYRIRTDDVCAFRDGRGRSRGGGVVCFLRGSYSDSAAATVEYAESAVRGWCPAKVFRSSGNSPIPRRSLPICPTTSGWPIFSAVARPHPNHTVQRLFPHGRWSIRRDKSPVSMGHTTPIRHHATWIVRHSFHPWGMDRTTFPGLWISHEAWVVQLLWPMGHGSYDMYSP